MTNWIFQSTPKTFDIAGFLNSQPRLSKWRASSSGIGGKIKTGDRVFVWRAMGSGHRKLAGVVAAGEVVGPIVTEADDSAAHSFWLDKNDSDRIEPRIEISLTRFAIPGKHLRRDDLMKDPIFMSSSIIKVRAGTNFELTLDQYNRLDSLWEAAFR